MRIADTSALYAFFTLGDAHHRRAVRAMEQPEPLVIPAEVLTEFILLLQRRVGYAKARGAAEFLWHADNTEIQASDTAILMAAWEEYSANPKLTYPDSIVVAWCREHEAEPLAYDKDLLRACRA